MESSEHNWANLYLKDILPKMQFFYEVTLIKIDFNNMTNAGKFLNCENNLLNFFFFYFSDNEKEHPHAVCERRWCHFSFATLTCWVMNPKI